MANPNKIALKISEKKGAWAYPGAAQFLGTPIISGMGKATDFKFCRNIHRVDWNKKPVKKFGNNSRGHSQGVSLKFSGHPRIGRIARSSLR